MSSQSDGLQPKVDPKKFLSSYIDIEKLDEERSAAPGDEALRGKVGSTLKDKVEQGVLVV
jgi:hypothetical protein